MPIIQAVLGMIITFVIIGALMRLLYLIGSRSFIVKEITRSILKLFQKSGN